MAKTSLTYLYVKKKCDKFNSNFYSVAIEDAKPKLVTRRASGDKVSMSTVILPQLIVTLTLLTPKIWLLILPSSSYTFPCKSVMRIQS